MEPYKIMNRLIKLIWDFRGLDSLITAKHHQKHLEEYFIINPYKINITGTTEESDFYSITYIVVEESDMIHFRDILKPHRAEIYE